MNISSLSVVIIIVELSVQDLILLCHALSCDCILFGMQEYSEWFGSFSGRSLGLIVQPLILVYHMRKDIS